MKNRISIIGLSGTNGAGKDLVGQILAEQHGYLFVSVSDLLREECRRRGLPVVRENLRKISAEWRSEQGLGVLVDRSVDEWKAAKSKYQGIITGSLRNQYEADRIHELGGTMLWVDADIKVRYQRVTGGNRGRGSEDERTLEQFLDDEKAEMNPLKADDKTVLNMAAVKERSDIFLENNSDSPQTLRQDLEAALGLTSS